MKTFPLLRTCALAILLSASTAYAQRGGGAAVTSPEVAADKHVTFRVKVPKASEVTLTGDWLAPNTTLPLVKNDQGVWSVTVGPMEPGFMIYNFNVDGLAIADPINPRMKLRASTSASVVEVPGDGKQLWEIQNVPHGKVELNFIPTKVLNDQTREVRVYTPPGYDGTGATKYPIMYLFHGTNDTAAGWTEIGRANYIVDNLIAQKKAVPMIVVMPFGHAAPYGARGGANNTTLFEQYLLQDVMPVINKTYRVAPGRENSAIVGLSMGGGQAIAIGMAHLDLFSAIGAFSAPIPGDFETRYKDLVNDPAAFAAKLNTFYIGCGKLDPAFGASQRLDALLTTHKIAHTFKASEGYHNYINWRLYLGETVPLLFQPKAK